MDTIESSKLSNDTRTLKGLRVLGAFIALLWIIKSIEIALDIQLFELGVYPRTLEGILGIFFSPLLHADIFHLLSNSIPIAIMGILLILVYRKYALDVFVLIYLFSGIALWLVGRSSYHIGASGVVYGLFGFIFFIGLFLNQNSSMLVSTALFFLYGGIFYGIFPDRPEVSWEAHLTGLFVGFVLATIFKKKYRNVQIEIPNKENVNCNFTKPETNFVYEYKKDRESEPKSVN
jgi:membrane associated rhomboid family serine protease